MARELPDTTLDAAVPKHQEAIVRWAVVTQNIMGASYLFLVDVSAAETGEVVFKKIKEEYTSLAGSSYRDGWISNLFTKVVVGSAEIQWRLENTKDSQRCARVHIRDEKDDLLLSEAFHQPQILAHEYSFIHDKLQFVTAPCGPRHSVIGQEAVLIRRRSSKRRIAWLLSFLLVISPAVGAVIGCYTHRADVGVTVSAGIFALASFLLGLAAWLEV